MTCEVCKRVHPAPACERGSVKMCVTFPDWVHSRLLEHVPWGERSPWIVALVRKELGV